MTCIDCAMKARKKSFKNSEKTLDKTRVLV